MSAGAGRKEGGAETVQEIGFASKIYSICICTLGSESASIKQGMWMCVCVPHHQCRNDEYRVNHCEVVSRLNPPCAHPRVYSRGHAKCAMTTCVSDCVCLCVGYYLGKYEEQSSVCL